MIKLDNLAYHILYAGTLISTYEATDRNDCPINAVEIKYGDDIVIMFFDSGNVCTGIVTGG